MKPTGSSPDGLIRLATGMYNGTHMQNEMDHCGTQFKMLEAWKVLRTSPKFSGGLTQVSCAVNENGDSPPPEACNIESDHGSPNSTDLAGEYKADIDTKHEKSELGSSGRSVGRPRGRKAGKETLNRDDMSKKRMRLLEDDVRAAQSKAIALQEYNMIKIMTKLFDKGNAAAIKCFENRAEIEMARQLKEMPDQESSVGNSNSTDDSVCVNATAADETEENKLV
jgi:hypothetical protein